MDDKVSIGVFQQVMWERDVALAQLAEIGKGLGAKMDDVRTVVRGEWIPVDEKNDAFDCSNCDAMVKRRYNFCPKCGADMRGTDDAK